MNEGFFGNSIFKHELNLNFGFFVKWICYFFRVLNPPIFHHFSYYVSTMLAHFFPELVQARKLIECENPIHLQQHIRLTLFRFHTFSIAVRSFCHVLTQFEFVRSSFFGCTFFFLLPIEHK